MSNKRKCMHAFSSCILRHKEPVFLHAARFTLLLPSRFHVFLHARFAASSHMFQVSFLPRQFKTQNWW